jgi:hypothetical protein
MAHLENLPQTIRQALRPKITALTDELLAEVHAAEPRRTGRLVAATQAFVDEGENYIRGRVRVVGSRSNIHAIAAVLEYGGHRALEVRPYQRRTGPVKGYQRRENITEQRFLRGPEAGIQKRALAEIEAALNAALNT